MLLLYFCTLNLKSVLVLHLGIPDTFIKPKMPRADEYSLTLLHQKSIERHHDDDIEEKIVVLMVVEEEHSHFIFARMLMNLIAELA